MYIFVLVLLFENRDTIHKDADREGGDVSISYFSNGYVEIPHVNKIRPVGFGILVRYMLMILHRFFEKEVCIFVTETKKSMYNIGQRVPRLARWDETNSMLMPLVLLQVFVMLLKENLSTLYNSS